MWYGAIYLMVAANVATKQRVSDRVEQRACYVTGKASRISERGKPAGTVVGHKRSAQMAFVGKYSEIQSSEYYYARSPTVAATMTNMMIA